MATSNHRTHARIFPLRDPKVPPNMRLNILWHFEPKGNQSSYSYRPTQAEKEDVNNTKWAKGKYFWPRCMNNWVKNYWARKQEKTFPISFKEADEKLKNVKNGVLAFCVENIENPRKVKANWITIGQNDIGSINNILSNNPNISFANLQDVNVYLLDPFFFKLGSHNDEINKSVYSENTNGYDLRNLADGNYFKYYVKRTVNRTGGTKNIGNYPYEKLELVGRIIEKCCEDCVVITVGVKDPVRTFFYYFLSILLLLFRLIGLVPAYFPSLYKYLIKPPNTDGPTGPGGGGAMP